MKLSVGPMRRNKGLRLRRERRRIKGTSEEVKEERGLFETEVFCECEAPKKNTCSEEKSLRYTAVFKGNLSHLTEDEEGHGSVKGTS